MSKVDNENREGKNNKNGYIPGDEQEENDDISGENGDIESYSKVRISNYIEQLASHSQYIQFIDNYNLILNHLFNI